MFMYRKFSPWQMHVVDIAWKHLTVTLCLPVLILLLIYLPT